MKTADLILEFEGQTFSDHYQVVHWLELKCKQLELESFKAGERFAAEIASKVEANNVESDLMCKMHLGDCPSAILTDCENRKELP